MAGGYTIEFYEDDDGRRPVEDWMEHDLDDTSLAALLAALELVLAQRGHQVCATEWGKPLGAGLFEFRIRHSAAEIARMFGAQADETPKGQRVLLRIFFHPYGDRIVLLLGGYDKGDDPSEKRQRREIGVARKRLTEWEQRRARERRRGGR